MRLRLIGGWLLGSIVAVAVPESSWAAGELTATGAVMHTNGKFEVGDTGEATYTIPIAVPPGAPGIQPAPSLVYSGRTGNTALGAGWALAGLSVITLCPATFVQDSYYDPPRGDGQDRFCLDGQRLIAVNGQYGATSTEYRTERETFTRVVSYGTAGSEPAYFRAWTKSGLIMEFGNTADSQVKFTVRVTPRAWAVNRIQDTAGNYMTMTYYQDTGWSGQFYPTRIDYTGNAGVSPSLSVQFTYENRSDVTDSFVFGVKLETDSRLTQIQT